MGHASAGDDGLLAGLAARARDRRRTFGLDVCAPPVAAPLCAWLDPAGGDAIVLRPSWRGPDGSAVVRLVRDGSIAAVGKLGLGPASAGVGDREAAAVAALGPPARAAGARVPELRGTVALAGRTAAVLSALDGRPLARASRHRVEQATRPVVEWLARFVAATTGRAEAPGVVEAALLAPAREVLSGLAGATAYLERLEGLGRRLGDGPVPVAAAHGDLTTWNVLDGDEPGVVDWEGAQTAAPPLVDLPYLLVDSRLARIGGDDRLAAFQACFPAGGAVELRAGTLELDPEVALLSFHACWLGHALDEQSAWHRRAVPGDHPRARAAVGGVRGRRILVVTPFAPAREAPHGGSRIVAETLQQLATRHRVALLTLHGHGEPATDPALSAVLDHVEEVERRPIGRSTRRLLAERGRVAAIARRDPPWVVGSEVAEARRALPRLVRAWRPDVVQFEFLAMARYASAVGETRPATVLVHHDAAPDGRDAPTSAWARHARRALTSVDALVVFSEEDRRRSVGLGPERIHVIRPGIDLPPPAEGPGRGIVFVGSFAHAPNLEAALRLAREIHPRVRSRLPDAELTLVGADPPAGLAGLPGVVATGRVADAAAFVNAAAVVAAPLASGAGVRIKVLDALARGKPLVATTRAVEGLELVDGEHALVRDDDVGLRRRARRPPRRPDGARARGCRRASLGAEQPLVGRRARPVRPALRRGHGRMTTPRIAVVVPTIGEADALARCLDALLAGGAGRGRHRRPER